MSYVLTNQRKLYRGQKKDELQKKKKYLTWISANIWVMLNILICYLERFYWKVSESGISSNSLKTKSEQVWSIAVYFWSRTEPGACSVEVGWQGGDAALDDFRVLVLVLTDTIEVFNVAGPAQQLHKVFIVCDDEQLEVSLARAILNDSAKQNKEIKSHILIQLKQEMDSVYLSLISESADVSCEHIKLKCLDNSYIKYRFMAFKVMWKTKYIFLFHS